MKPLIKNNFQETITKAMREVAMELGPENGARKFIPLTGKNSYGNPLYKVEFWVLEGSPPKGYVVADHAKQHVIAFDFNFKVINEWKGLEYTL